MSEEYTVNDTIAPTPLEPELGENQVDVEFRGPFEAQVALLVEFGKAQSEFDDMKKDTQGQSGHQVFKYMNYASLKAAVVKQLAAHGIGFTQPFSSSRPSAEEGFMLLTSILAGHGAMMICRQWFPTMSGSPNANDGQTRNVKDLGGLMTYYRRYAAQAILAVEGDRDEDQNPNPAQHRQETPPSSGQRRPQGRPQQARKPQGRPQRGPREPEPAVDQVLANQAEAEGQPGKYGVANEPQDTPKARTDEQNAQLKELFGKRYGGSEHSELSDAERGQLIKRDCMNWVKATPNELNWKQAQTVIAKLVELTQ